MQGRGRERTVAERILEEQSTGLKWDPEGLLWDQEAVSKLPPVTSQYPDWMHVMVASGGFAAYEVNGLAHACVARELSLDDIDDWIAQVQVPKGMTPLKRHFFRDRMPGNPLAPARAFAAELLTAIVLFGFFLDVCVGSAFDRDVEWVEQICCFNLLRVMLQILQRADAKEIGTFRDAAQAHHDIFRKYYHMTVKIHVPIHIADYWERWLQLLSCFSAERNHKLFKRICNFSYRKAGSNALAYSIATWFENLKDPTSSLKKGAWPPLGGSPFSNR